MFFGGFPFGDGGHSRSFNEQAKKSIDNTTFYNLLGVQPGCTQDAIKKAYRHLALKHHPDKGGDKEQFTKICRAYEILSDEEKRKIYDEYGEEGVKGQPQTSATDIYDLVFGSGGRRSGSQKQKKGEDVTSKLKVTLEQLYTGSIRKLAVNRDRICPKCNGAGGPPDAIITCSDCKGQGVHVIVRRMGPLIQQHQSVCESCKGSGKSILDSKKCTDCIGQGTTKDKKILEVSIERGMSHGKKIIFDGEADQKPGEIAGNVVFILDEEEHSRFTRKGNDLIHKTNITLYEALTGSKIIVNHLDGRSLVVSLPKGTIIKPGDLCLVNNEGMPIEGRPNQFGSLYLTFNVIFPTQSEISEELLKLLPKPIPVDVDPNSDMTEYKSGVLVDSNIIKPEEKNHSNSAESSDDEGRQQGVQCNQQ